MTNELLDELQTRRAEHRDVIDRLDTEIWQKQQKRKEHESKVADLDIAIAALEPAPDLSEAQKQQIDAANAEYVQATGQAVAEASPEPASEQDPAPLPTHQTDAGSAPDAAQGDLNGIETTHYPPILTPEPQTYTTETGLTLAPGEVLPDPALHPEHDGTGYWSGNVDGETP